MMLLQRALFFPGHSQGVDSDDGVDRSGHSREPLVLGLTCTFWSLAIITVAMRIYSRTKLTRFWGTDDWWMLAAMLFATGDQFQKILWCLHGVGRHVEDVSAEDINIVLKIGYAISVMYPITLGLVKISVLTFYLRLFPDQKFRQACYMMIGVVVASALAVSLGQATACTPISDAWALNTVAHCVNRAALQYASSAINLITDLIVLVFPLKYLWALSLDKKKRFSIIGLFSLGLMSCVASGVRISTIRIYYQGTDPTWDASSIAICSSVEMNLTIITTSIPSAQIFVVRYIVRPLKALLLGKSCDTRVELSKSSPDSSNTMASKPGLSYGSYREPVLNMYIDPEESTGQEMMPRGKLNV